MDLTRVRGILELWCDPREGWLADWKQTTAAEYLVGEYEELVFGTGHGPHESADAVLDDYENQLPYCVLRLRGEEL